MKSVAAVATGLAGLVTAVAGAGWYAVAGLTVLGLAMVAGGCWVIANSRRTAHAVALITAARGAGTYRPDGRAGPTLDRRSPSSTGSSPPGARRRPHPGR